jgi:enoyl-CoA hydratase/carnithine racemase
VIKMRLVQQVFIALVHGAAAGGGFALALASDIRIAGESARMNAAFIRIGLGACDIGASYFLPRIVGSSVAAELLLTGNFIEAPRALATGSSRASSPTRSSSEPGARWPRRSCATPRSAFVSPRTASTGASTRRPSRRRSRWKTETRSSPARAATSRGSQGFFGEAPAQAQRRFVPMLITL